MNAHTLCNGCVRLYDREGGHTEGIGREDPLRGTVTVAVERAEGMGEREALDGEDL